jgi:hypothetical protein
LRLIDSKRGQEKCTAHLPLRPRVKVVIAVINFIGIAVMFVGDIGHVVGISGVFAIELWPPLRDMMSTPGHNYPC